MPAAPAANIWDEQPVQIIQTLEAKFPLALSARGIREGEVRAMLLVDADGKLADCLVTAYTEPEFAAELLTAVRGWEYIPARQRGEPIGQRLQIVFNFQQKGAIVSMIASAAVAASLNRLTGASPLTYLVCRASELDRIPVVLHSESPRHPGQSLKIPNGSASID